MNLNERLISVRSPQQAVEPAAGAGRHRSSPPSRRSPTSHDRSPSPAEALFHAPAAAPSAPCSRGRSTRRHEGEGGPGALRPDRDATERLDAHRGSAPSDRPSRARRDRRGGATRPLDRGAEPSHRRDRCRRARLRAARGVARGSDGERDHGESVRSALRRAQWSTDGDVAPLHRRTPAATRDRTDRLAGRTTNRRIVAPGRRPSRGRFPRQRDHSSARGQRLFAHDPEVRGDPVHE